MDEARTRQLVKLHEGSRNRLYRDTLGNLTIGVGHLVPARDRAKYEGRTLTDAEIDELFKDDLNAAHFQLATNLPWFTRLSDVRKAVLVDMCFNLGLRGLLKFTNTLPAVERGEYLEAARFMLANKKWRSQVGNRVRRLAAMMSTGRWPSEIGGTKCGALH